MNLINEILKIKPAQQAENKSVLYIVLKNLKIDKGEILRRLQKEMQVSADDAGLIARQDYLIKWHNKIYSELSGTDIEFVTNSISRLVAAKFSGKAQSNLSIDIALNKLIYAIKNKTPIKFIFGFGGYKNHNSPSSPEVDLAELFQMNYMANWLLPIIQSYEHGAQIIYESEEIAVQFNNVPQENTDKYTESFRRLIVAFVKRFFELNEIRLNITLVLARDVYSEKELKEKIEPCRSQMEDTFNALSAEEKEIWLRRAENNFMICGTKDYSDASRDELSKIITDARITNECFLAADYELRQSFFEQPNAIAVFGTWGIMPCASPTDGGFHIKSTRFGNTDAWIGTGVFHIKDSEIRDEILSAPQYDKVKNEIKLTHLEDSDFNSVSKNFEKLPVIKKA